MSTRIPFLDELRADLLAKGTVVPVPGPSAGRRPRGPAAAAVAFVVVLAVGGLVMWIATSRDGPEPVAGPYMIDWHLRALFEAPDDPSGLIATVEALDGVVETQYFADASVPFPRPPLPEDMEALPTLRTATLLVRLDGSGRAEETAQTIRRIDGVWSVVYAEGVAASRAEAYFAWAADSATVVRRDPLVLQPSQGPEPRFDPSGLGREIVMEAAALGDITDDVLERRSPMMWERPEYDELGIRSPPRRDPARPILHIGHIGRDPVGGVRLIVFPTVHDGKDGWCDTVNGGAACGSFSEAGYGIVSVGSIGFLTAWVPDSTSVVRFVAEGEDPMWQRPTAGWALFPVGSRVWEGLVAMTLEAYDVDGALIGRWEW